LKRTPVGLENHSPRVATFAFKPGTNFLPRQRLLRERCELRLVEVSVNAPTEFDTLQPRQDEQGSFDSSQFTEAKVMRLPDDNHGDVNLADLYWTHYGSTKASADRDKSIVERIRSELDRKFAREVDGIAVQRW
jgi:hypothetical protein